MSIRVDQPSRRSGRQGQCGSWSFRAGNSMSSEQPLNRAYPADRAFLGHSPFSRAHHEVTSARRWPSVPSDQALPPRHASRLPSNESATIHIAVSQKRCHRQDPARTMHSYTLGRRLLNAAAYSRMLAGVMLPPTSSNLSYEATMPLLVTGIRVGTHTIPRMTGTR